MPLPAQVKKQSKEVQELHKELLGEESEDELDKGELEDQEDKSKSKEDPNEKRWNDLQGMFENQSNELQKFKNENDALQVRLQSMEQMVSFAQEPAKTPEKDAKVESLITTKDGEDYGEDTIDLVRRVSEDTIRKYLGKFESASQDAQKQIVPQIQQVADQQAKTSDQLFWSQLNAGYPEWKKTNEDPEFHNWLAEVDNLSGFSRQNHLDQARNAQDSERVIAFFNTWEQRVAKSKGDTPVSELEEQIAPGRTLATAVSTGDEQRTYTRKQIAKFYENLKMGKYAGKDGDREKIERDIIKAISEGRVIE